MTPRDYRRWAFTTLVTAALAYGALHNEALHVLAVVLAVGLVGMAFLAVLVSLFVYSRLHSSRDDALGEVLAETYRKGETLARPTWWVWTDRTLDTLILLFLASNSLTTLTVLWGLHMVLMYSVTGVRSWTNRTVDEIFANQVRGGAGEVAP